MELLRSYDKWRMNTARLRRWLFASKRTGGGQRLQPVFCIVCQASIALCLSILRWVIGTGERGGIQLKVRTSTHWAWTVAMEGLK